MSLHVKLWISPAHAVVGGDARTFFDIIGQVGVFRVTVTSKTRQADCTKLFHQVATLNLYLNNILHAMSSKYFIIYAFFFNQQVSKQTDIREKN